MPYSNLPGLLYRRQFVLGPRRVAALSTWRAIELRGGLQLQIQPDLPHTQFRSGRLQLDLLGFVIDPTGADSDDAAILRSLAAGLRCASDAPAAANSWGGRWVLIVDDGASMVIFHDPCGLREVYYSTAAAGEFWCASQPSFLAAELGLREWDDEAREFQQSRYFRQHHEPWWPGDATPFREIRHLLPNHCLHVEQRRASRYWPTEPLVTLSMPEAAQRAAALLRAVIRQASRRFPLAMPLTAGMDSRTILAATRDLPDIFHYTLRRHPLPLHAADLWIPRRLLEQLGRAHTVIHCTGEMSPAFAAVYERNVMQWHASAGAIAEALLVSYPRGRVMLSGHCSEIARDTFHVTHTRVDDAEPLARVFGMRDTPFALQHFQAWLDATRPAVEPLGYGLWELFFWENECGNWAANGQAQWDLVHERFTPFNLRPLLVLLLGVEPAQRQAPNYSLYRRIMELLWPEVLSEPFNPKLRSPRQQLRQVLVRIESQFEGEEIPRLLRSGSSLLGLSYLALQSLT